jgi:hypothetical protein
MVRPMVRPMVRLTFDLNLLIDGSNPSPSGVMEKEKLILFLN